ncbi:tether containing UBX domain for GLUT4 [Cololabis saira]|uniref:tether containing UBX domain for GLUT4 n=1 Tax=Cololabis saira TaxID=129043 RepID=UPI002AD4A386|nr:tether containing UBX domain for GLUT4 [Cololabis saira]
MAASGSAVTVLTPNGRRQTIKVSHNTPLLQVLEDVCKKHGFNPDDHGLKFQRTVLDLTLQWRFANLPNNAKLEMVTTSRKQGVAESQVRIALQMEDGSRHQGSFTSGQSLWELITNFQHISESELSKPGSTPVCVYMRDEVSGEEALKKATLKSLGLTGGNAIVRFLLKKDKSPEEYEDSVAAPITPVAKESIPSSPPPPDPAPLFPEISTIPVPIKNLRPDEPEEATPAPSPATITSSIPVQQEDITKTQNAVRPKIPPTGSHVAVEDEDGAGPSGLNCHPSTSASSPPSAPFIPFSGGGQRLGGPGVGTGGHSLTSSSSLSAAMVESPRAKKAKSSHGSSDKCEAAANLEDQYMDHKEEYLEEIDREPLIYHLDSTSHPTEDHADLPQEFFEVTMDDVRRRFAQLKSERKLLEEAPLITKALRESQMKEKMGRYPKVVLRVQFPDRYVLQGFFRPLETVGAVRQFVRSHLDDPQLPFHLFITPPKTLLDDHSVTLFQADLFPGALVYFGSDVKKDFYIKRELLQTSISALQANESVASCMLRPPAPSSSGAEEPLLPPEPAADTSVSKQEEQDPPAPTQAATSSRSDPGKVPKWLKLPGKK